MVDTNKNYISKLKATLGSESVFDQPEILKEYSDDWTEIPGHLPDVIVKVKTVDEIQFILKIANEYKIPVVPRVANSNIGGLAIPEHGGVVVNLTEMNQIVETNEADMYSIIEPGVTWADIKTHLAQNYPLLRFGYSLSPPDTSIMANCLMDGLSNLSLIHGSTAHW
ncbi:MAG: FAD-binding oxidoreductase, partial [bacterium]